MKKLPLLSLFSALLLTSCKNPPPDITPCLIALPTMQAQFNQCLLANYPMNDPHCVIDIRTTIANCTPVNLSATKPRSTRALWQMDKYYTYSNSDSGTLLQWIVQNSQ